LSSNAPWGAYTSIIGMVSPYRPLDQYRSPVFGAHSSEYVTRRRAGASPKWMTARQLPPCHV
jgi:hypothetical protein